MKKSLAVLLAAAMTMGMSVSAFAAGATEGTDTTSTGTGTYEGQLNQTTYNVTLPAAANATFSYYMDPGELIEKTDGDRYESDNYVFEDASIYFPTSKEGDVTTYTNTTSKLKVVNMSTDDIGVTVVASIPKNDTQYTMVANESAFNASGAKEFYFGLITCPGVADANGKKGEQTTAVNTDATSDYTATAKLLVAGVEENFEVSWINGENEYGFAQKDGVSEINFNSFEFCIEGACNTNGNEVWGETFSAPTLTVTWKFDKITDSNKSSFTAIVENAEEYVEDQAPSVANAAVLVRNAESAVISVDYGKGDKIVESITGVTWEGAAQDWLTFDSDAKTVTITGSACINYLIDTPAQRNIVITFNVGDPITVTLDVAS